MTIQKVFTFFFPRSVYVEPADKFRALQLLRFEKAGVLIKSESAEGNIVFILNTKTELDKGFLEDDSSDPLLEQISQIHSDLATIIFPLSFTA